VRHCAGSRRGACERPPYLRAQHDRRPVGPGPGGAPRRRRGVARRNRHRASTRGARVAARRCEQETELILETAKSTLLAPFELESGKQGALCSFEDQFSLLFATAKSTLLAPFELESGKLGA